MALEVLALDDGGSAGDGKRLQSLYIYIYTCRGDAPTARANILSGIVGGNEDNGSTGHHLRQHTYLRSRVGRVGQLYISIYIYAYVYTYIYIYIYIYVALCHLRVAKGSAGSP